MLVPLPCWLLVNPVTRRLAVAGKGVLLSIIIIMSAELEATADEVCANCGKAEVET